MDTFGNNLDSDEVPAHVISVSLIEVTDKNGQRKTDITNKLSMISHRLDLTDMSEVEAEEAELNGETSPLVSDKPSTNLNASFPIEGQIDSSRIARFQYDGILFFEPHISTSNDESGSCANYSITAIASGKSKSFHVLKSKAEFELEILARQMIISSSESETGEAVYCGIVRDTNITVINYVGLVDSNQNDAKTIAKLRSVDADISLYTRCTKGCILEVYSGDIDSNTTTDTPSSARVHLQAGNPEVVEKPSDPHAYAKTITIQSGQSQHIMWVVVVGHYSEGPPNRSVIFTQLHRH